MLFNKKKQLKSLKINNKLLTINVGPQHPAMHGVLRLICLLSYEFIIKIDPHIGLLHRGTEKLIEYKNTLLQPLPYFSRLDYVSPTHGEHLYSLMVEKFFNIQISKEYMILRVIILELNRIANHLLAITTHSLDCGMLTPFLWGFEEREKIMLFFDWWSGARVHTCLIKPGGLQNTNFKSKFLRLIKFIKNFKSRINELEELMNKNYIWEKRLRNIGIVDINLGWNHGFSGILIRGGGFPYDIRKLFPYEIYNDINFEIVISPESDCYSRFLCRMYEMKQSVLIIEAAINNFNNSIKIENLNELELLDLNYKISLKKSMENLINHFQYHSSVFYNNNKLLLTTSIEAPKGDFSCIFTNAEDHISRFKIRAPGFYHIQGVDYLTHSHLLSDLVAIVGTCDLVLGEVDR